MEIAELDCNAMLWERCKRRLQDAQAHTPELQLVVLDGLLPEWCIDGEGMQEILEYGAGRGELSDAMPALWQRQRQQQQQDAESRGAPQILFVSPPADLPPGPPEAEPRGTADNPHPHGVLPTALQPFARAIGEYSRKQGRAALQLGRQLCSARETCRLHALSFPAFLQHLRHSYGLSRGTCYLYMKYCEWNFPDGLGSAVMKWIVQGFAPGSADAEQVINAAASENLTLAALEDRFGALRDKQLPDAATDSQGAALSAPASARAVRRVERSLQRLHQRRRSLDAQIECAEQHLRRLRGEKP